MLLVGILFTNKGGGAGGSDEILFSRCIIHNGTHAVPLEFLEWPLGKKQHLNLKKFLLEEGPKAL